MRRNATLKGRCVEKKKREREKEKKFKTKKKERQRKRKIKSYHVEHGKATASIIKTSRLV